MSSSRQAALLAAVALVCAVLVSCGLSAEQSAAGRTGGDPRRGRANIEKYGCCSCHTIPGIPAAHGMVGPPLTGFGQRSYVAGVLTNTADNVGRWIENPKSVDEKTAMPVLGVSAQEAIDIVAYLYSTK